MIRKIFIVLVLALVLVANGWTQSGGTTILKRYTTYQTSLTNEDIMRLFVNEVRDYLQRYNSNCSYDVYFNVNQNKNEQNSAWGMQTTIVDGEFHTIELFVSNGLFMIGFFKGVLGSPFMPIVTTRAGTVGGNQIRQHIVNTATSMFNESEMVLKMYNDSYSDASKRAFSTNILRILQ